MEMGGRQAVGLPDGERSLTAQHCCSAPCQMAPLHGRWRLSFCPNRLRGAWMLTSCIRVPGASPSSAPDPAPC